MGQQLKDKVAIIVGASSGMGKATAELFAAEGAKVVLAARRAAELPSSGNAIAIRTDVGVRAQVDELVRQTVERFGRVDILVYATGTNIPDRSLQRLTDETWDMMLRTNLTGAFYCTSAVLPVMRRQRDGLLIYISTGAVQRPDVSGVSYQASKHGLTGLAHGTMQEERANGIRTSIIFPGLTDTPLVLKRPKPTPLEVMAKALKPDDVARACLFIASQSARCHVPELILLPSAL